VVLRVCVSLASGTATVASDREYTGLGPGRGACHLAQGARDANGHLWSVWGGGFFFKCLSQLLRIFVWRRAAGAKFVARCFPSRGAQTWGRESDFDGLSIALVVVLVAYSLMLLTGVLDAMVLPSPCCWPRLCLFVVCTARAHCVIAHRPLGTVFRAHVAG